MLEPVVLARYVRVEVTKENESDARIFLKSILPPDLTKPFNVSFANKNI
jgi:hypothetical protein